MPRGLRSSRKQPDFDPSELDDLIFSPAVGTGVGSHLINRPPRFPAPTPSQSPVDDPIGSNGLAMVKPTTVVMSTNATVDHSATFSPAVDMGVGSHPLDDQPHFPAPTPVRLL